MKIVVDSNPEPPSWGSQFGAAGRAGAGAVVVVVVAVVVVVVLGAVIEGGPAVVGVVVDTEVIAERGTF